MIMKKFLASLLFVCLMSSAAFCDVAINAVNFPDETFREFVKQFDGDNDGVLNDDEIASVDGIHVQESGISSLKGIEYFTNITQLNCQDNNLSSLDVHNSKKNLPLLWVCQKPDHCMWRHHQY